MAATVRVHLTGSRHLGSMKTTWTWFSDVTCLALSGCVLAGCPMDDDDEPMSASTSSTSGATTQGTSSSGDAVSTSTAGPGTDASTTASATTTTTANTSESSGSGSTTDGADTEATAYAVSGSVTLSAMLPPDGDGVGTLVVGAFAECSLQAPVVLGAAIIPNADLSAEGSAVEYTIESLPEGAVFLVSFLDDDGNLDPKNPLPDDGDPVLAEGVGDGILTCIEVGIDGDDVLGVAIDLNEIAMPQG